MSKEAPSQYVDAPKQFTGNNKWMAHSGYKMMVGAGRNVFFLNLISQIKNKMEALVIVITAKGGKGKTYLGLRLAQILDPKFNPNIQVVYDREQMMNLISEDSPLKRWQVVLIDEAQFSMGGRNWHEQLQKDLMEQMEAIRSKGLIIILVALGVDLLDIVMRKHVINYRIHLERKGVGTVYTYDSDRFTGEEQVWKIGQVRFLLPGWEECQCLSSCLTCKFSGLQKSKYSQRNKWEEIGFKPCQNLRNVYELKKKSYVEEKNKASVSRAKEAEKKKRVLDKGEAVKYLLSLDTPVKFNRTGTPDKVDTRMRLEAKYPDIRVSRDVLDDIRSMYQVELAKVS